MMVNSLPLHYTLSIRHKEQYLTWPITIHLLMLQFILEKGSISSPLQGNQGNFRVLISYVQVPILTTDLTSQFPCMITSMFTINLSIVIYLWHLISYNSEFYTMCIDIYSDKPSIFVN